MFSDLSDLVVATCSDVLGDVCTYSYQGGGDESFNVIYVKERDVYETEQAIVTGVSELVSAPLSSFSQTPKQGDSLVLKSRTFDVIDVDPDDVRVILFLRLS